MEDEHQQPTDGVADAPPAADMEASGQRHKRSRKGVFVALGALLVFVVGAWLILFGGGGDQQTPTLEGQGEQEGQSRIDSRVREGGIGGGVRQEVATVQADIEEEELRQERLESGRSVITFGESLIGDDQEDSSSADQPNLDEATQPANSTFGEIGREPPAPPKKSLGSNPGRQQVRIAGRNGTRGGQQGTAETMSAAIAQEIQLYNDEQRESSRAAEELVYYAPPIVQRRPGDHEAQGERQPDRGQYAAGELAMPGDTVAAYMENRITSEQPSGRVVATILEGPLEGAKAIGEASFEGERLLITFSRIVTDNDRLISGIEALAVDPRSMETSLQSGVDRKLFRRYGVPLLYGIAAIGLDYASVKDQTTVVEQDLETGETVSRSVNTDPSFGDYMRDNASDALDEPLGRAANEAANAKPMAWANPGVIGILFDTQVPKN